jgi:lipoyl(octanoyl) transferase
LFVIGSSKGPRAKGKMRAWYLVDLGLMPYDDCWALQLQLVEKKVVKEEPRDIVLMVEHEPVVTVGRRGDLGGLKVSEDILRRMGIALRAVERGGLLTYHGPGQLVVYPIVNLRSNGLNVMEYVNGLEEVMIRTLARFGLKGCRNPMNRGVWVGGRKIGSLGIAVRRGIAFHGLALNVDMDLRPFGLMEPCGLKGVEMTSMAAELGKGVDIGDVKREIVKDLDEVFGVKVHLDKTPWKEMEGAD